MGVQGNENPRKWGQEKRRVLATASLLVYAFLVAGCNLGASNVSQKATPKSSTRTSTSTTTTTSSATGTATSRTVDVAWDSNREAAVNTTGGGYRVLFANNVAMTGASVKTVSYVSGTIAPNSTSLTGLSTGTWFIQVVAFSTLNTAGNTSTQTSVVVP